MNLHSGPLLKVSRGRHVAILVTTYGVQNFSTVCSLRSSGRASASSVRFAEDILMKQPQLGAL